MIGVVMREADGIHRTDAGVEKLKPEFGWRIHEDPPVADFKDRSRATSSITWIVRPTYLTIAPDHRNAERCARSQEA
jgi:hypothetical protein